MTSIKLIYNILVLKKNYLIFKALILKKEKIMRKTLLLTFMSLFIISGIANAQIFSENFEETGTVGEPIPNEPIVLDGWLNQDETGNRAWQWKLYDENFYAQMTSYNSDETNTTYLVTPLIDLSTATNPMLSFDVAIGYYTHDALTVLISDNYAGDIGDATWTDITSNFTIPQTPTDAYSSLETAGSMNLSSYSGMIAIAFRYDGDDASGETTTIQIDNILIEDETSIQDANTAKVSVHPNPTQDKLTVNSESTITKIEIINIIGQIQMERSTSSNLVTINTTALTPGVYFVKTEDGNGKINITKIVKE